MMKTRERSPCIPSKMRLVLAATLCPLLQCFHLLLPLNPQFHLFKHYLLLPQPKRRIRLLQLHQLTPVPQREREERRLE